LGHLEVVLAKKSLERRWTRVGGGGLVGEAAATKKRTPSSVDGVGDTVVAAAG